MSTVRTALSVDHIKCCNKTGACNLRSIRGSARYVVCARLHLYVIRVRCSRDRKSRTWLAC